MRGLPICYTEYPVAIWFLSHDNSISEMKEAFRKRGYKDKAFRSTLFTRSLWTRSRLKRAGLKAGIYRNFKMFTNILVDADEVMQEVRPVLHKLSFDYVVDFDIPSFLESEKLELEVLCIRNFLSEVYSIELRLVLGF